MRVFYAIWPDSPSLALLEDLARHVASETGGRVTASANLHLTLAFVGSVPLRDVDALAAIGVDAARAIAPFSLRLDRTGAFRDAGIAWIGAHVTPAPLRELAGRLKAGLASLGARTDARPFNAHITLARRCERGPRRREPPCIGWEVDAFTLTASEPAAGGSRYTNLVRIPLNRSSLAAGEPSASQAQAGPQECPRR